MRSRSDGGVSPGAAIRLQDFLAQAQRLRGDLDHFVVGDEFDGLFQIHQVRGSEADGFVGG